MVHKISDDVNRSSAYRDLERGVGGLLTRILGVRAVLGLFDLQRKGVRTTLQKVQLSEALWDWQAAIILKLGSSTSLWGQCSLLKGRAAITALP